MSIIMKKEWLINSVTPILVQLLVCQLASVSSDMNTDQLTLLALKSHFKDPHNILARNWSTSTSHCNWIGVSCGLQSVIALNLSNMALTGTIPSLLPNLSSLQVFDLSFNRLTGEIPGDAFDLLLRLQQVYLSGNQFYGEIPSSLFRCRELRVLSMSRNKFTGGIPVEIGNLTMLKELYLSENNFTGTIPPDIGKLNRLEMLTVHENYLVGSIPSELFNNSAIKVLRMAGNHLSGSLPSTIGLFTPNLTEINLQDNELRGAIPSSLYNASKLTILDLSFNLFSGMIPKALSNLRQLQVLNLAGNSLADDSSLMDSSFLRSLSNCEHLRKLDISGNSMKTTLQLPNAGNLSRSLQQFSANNCWYKGRIPANIGNYTSLILLSLANNEFMNPIPKAIGEFNKLQRLHLHGNNLNGTISQDLCFLKGLFDLSLGSNKLSGSIPECLGNLTRLSNLNLSSNNLSSTIPSSFWKLEDILNIDMSSNFLWGTLPSSITRLKVVVKVDLSKNLLSGNVPSEIGNLKSLVFLSLARNQFQGSIPSSFGDSVSLELLDLSCNNLSGSIPKSLENLSYLKFFNVSVNGLEGEIPDERNFRNFSAQSYLMNKALCGPWRLGVPACKTHILNGFLLKLLIPLVALLLVAYYVIIWMRLRQKGPKEIILEYNGKGLSLTYRELQRSTAGFSEEFLVGRGSLSSVYKGTLRDGMVVAIKVFDVENDISIQSFATECAIMHDIRHRNLSRIFCSCSSSSIKALVMEYMPNGTLERWLYTHNCRLDVFQRLEIIIGVASAIRYLHYEHQQVVIHCDIKPTNILLDQDMIARLCDFSIAKIIDPEFYDPSTNTLATGFSLGYAAPEIGFGIGTSREADVYSFGIMLMEIFTCKRPTDEMFCEGKSLRSWVQDSVEQSNDLQSIVDPFVLQTQEDNFDEKMESIMQIMKLAIACTSMLPLERLDMNKVENELQLIKRRLLLKILAKSNNQMLEGEVHMPGPEETNTMSECSVNLIDLDTTPLEFTAKQIKESSTSVNFQERLDLDTLTS